MHGTAWDSHSVSITSHCTVGWDGHLGLGVLYMGQLGIPTMCPLLPMVQWDGMDTWDWGTVHGTVWDSHSVSITSHGTVGWDGHLGLGVLYMGHLGILPGCAVGWVGSILYSVP